MNLKQNKTNTIVTGVKLSNIKEKEEIAKSSRGDGTDFLQKQQQSDQPPTSRQQ